MNYTELYNSIDACIRRWADTNPRNFKCDKQFLGLDCEDDGYVDVAIYDVNTPEEIDLKEKTPFFKLYDLDGMCEINVDEVTGDLYCYVYPEKVHPIVGEWCLHRLASKSNERHIPKIWSEDQLICFCDCYRDVIASGDTCGAPDVRVRYAVRDTMFHVATFGEFFFFENKLYVIDQDEKWKPYHDEFVATAFLGPNRKCRGYVHPVAFCGVQTPFTDDQGDPIFTGDICFDPMDDGCYHSVKADLFEGYGFSADNCMLLLDDIKKPIHRVGTIFYNLSLLDMMKTTWTTEISDMWGQADDIEVKLKKAKLTPSFMKEDMDYTVIAAITEEYDWRVIFDREDAYPEMLNEPHRISPSRITSLKPNQIFVFGSNIHGQHGGGAAAFAHKKFGAEWGVGEGLTGQCYALPTMEGEDSFRRAVRTFTICACEHPELTFLVTEVGCGIAGYTPEEVAPWFEIVAKQENVFLPLSFYNILNNIAE